MAKNIMVQGTMSSAGKSLLAAGICRVLYKDGLSVAPFKSQNMALNSFITSEGLEMGRAQVVQAEAAGIEPGVHMNPILLKPCSDMKSQVIVCGEPVGTMDADEYYKFRSSLKETIKNSYGILAQNHDAIVIEGAGSPVEINLNRDDIVNMGMAEMVDAPVVLVADIERGGVFAQIYGTVMLLDTKQRRRVKGIIINKFRGDAEILKPGLKMIQDLTGVPVIGVLPYLNIDIDDEDSITERHKKTYAAIDIAVIRFPRISNATDFAPLSRIPGMQVRYVRSAKELGQPDMIILPGTKSTMSDLLWMRQNGLESLVKKAAEKNIPIWGICGGYQMLGNTLSDPHTTELGGTLQGLGLLPTDTVFCREKTRLQSSGSICSLTDEYSSLSGACLRGYQIHMGQSSTNGQAFAVLNDGTKDGAVCKNICGTYMHGLFDGELAGKLAEWLFGKKGLTMPESDTVSDAAAFRETQFDILEQAIRKNVDIPALYRILNRE